jgi:hypothetical protein
LILILAAAGVVLANGGVDFPRWVLGGGASDSAAGGVSLRATLGQPIVGVVSGGDITLGQGFWGRGAVRYSVYMPLVLRNF